MNREDILNSINKKIDKPTILESAFSRMLRDAFSDMDSKIVYQRAEDSTTSGRPDVNLIRFHKIAQIELKSRAMPSRAFNFKSMYRDAQLGYYTSHLPFQMNLYTAVYFGNKKKGFAMLFNLADIQDVMRGGKYTIEQLRELSCAEGLEEVCQYLAKQVS